MLRERPWALKLPLLVLLAAVPCRAQEAAPAGASDPMASPRSTNNPAGDDRATPAALRAAGADTEGASSSRVAQFLLERAKDRFNRGVLEHDTAELEGALAVLHLGHRLTGDPAFQFNAARVARELGRCEEARTLYRDFITQESNAALKQRAEQRLTELGSCSPALPPEPLSLLPGEPFEVLPAAPWHADAAHAVGWDDLATDSLEQSRDGKRWLVWGLAGGAGVAAIVSGIFIAQAGSKDSQLQHLHSDSENLSQRIATLQARGRAAQTRARVSGGLALGLGAGAAVSYWWSSRADEAARSGLVLQASANGASASWTHRF